MVERRGRYGDWEVDTIIGKGQKQAIVSLTERRARFTLLAKVQTREAETVRQAVTRLLTPVANRVHTITADNGKEFAEHETIAEALEAADQDRRRAAEVLDIGLSTLYRKVKDYGLQGTEEAGSIGKLSRVSRPSARAASRPE